MSDIKKVYIKHKSSGNYLHRKATIGKNVDTVRRLGDRVVYEVDWMVGRRPHRTGLTHRTSMSVFYYDERNSIFWDRSDRNTMFLTYDDNLNMYMSLQGHKVTYRKDEGTLLVGGPHVGKSVFIPVELEDVEIDWNMSTKAQNPMPNPSNDFQNFVKDLPSQVDSHGRRIPFKIHTNRGYLTLTDVTFTLPSGEPFTDPIFRFGNSGDKFMFDDGNRLIHGKTREYVTMAGIESDHRAVGKVYQQLLMPTKSAIKALTWKGLGTARGRFALLYVPIRGSNYSLGHPSSGLVKFKSSVDPDFLSMVGSGEYTSSLTVTLEFDDSDAQNMEDRFRCIYGRGFSADGPVKGLGNYIHACDSYVDHTPRTCGTPESSFLVPTCDDKGLPPNYGTGICVPGARPGGSGPPKSKGEITNILDALGTEGRCNEWARKNVPGTKGLQNYMSTLCKRAHDLGINRSHKDIYDAVCGCVEPPSIAYSRMSPEKTSRVQALREAFSVGCFSEICKAGTASYAMMGAFTSGDPCPKCVQIQILNVSAKSIHDNIFNLTQNCIIKGGSDWDAFTSSVGGFITWGRWDVPGGQNKRAYRDGDKIYIREKFATGDLQNLPKATDVKDARLLTKDKWSSDDKSKTRWSYNVIRLLFDVDANFWDSFVRTAGEKISNDLIVSDEKVYATKNILGNAPFIPKKTRTISGTTYHIIGSDIWGQNQVGWADWLRGVPSQTWKSFLEAVRTRDKFIARVCDDHSCFNRSVVRSEKTPDPPEEMTKTKTIQGVVYVYLTKDEWERKPLTWNEWLQKIPMLSWDGFKDRAKGVSGITEKDDGLHIPCHGPNDEPSTSGCMLPSPPMGSLPMVLKKDDWTKAPAAWSEWLSDIPTMNWSDFKKMVRNKGTEDVRVHGYKGSEARNSGFSGDSVCAVYASDVLLKEIQGPVERTDLPTDTLNGTKYRVITESTWEKNKGGWSDWMKKIPSKSWADFIHMAERKGDILLEDGDVYISTEIESLADRDIDPYSNPPMNLGNLKKEEYQYDIYRVLDIGIWRKKADAWIQWIHGLPTNSWVLFLRHMGEKSSDGLSFNNGKVYMSEKFISNHKDMPIDPPKPDPSTCNAVFGHKNKCGVLTGDSSAWTNNADAWMKWVRRLSSVPPEGEVTF